MDMVAMAEVNEVKRPPAEQARTESSRDLKKPDTAKVVDISDAEVAHHLYARGLLTIVAEYAIDPATELQESCKRGNLAHVMWLVKKYSSYKLHADAERAGRGYCGHVLVTACAYGHLNIAKWLVAKFGKAFYCYDAICMAEGLCKAGASIKTVKWMAKKFKSQIDLAGRLQDACSAGDVRIARWISGKADLSLGGLTIRCGHPMLNALLSGKDGIVYWMIKTFNIRKKDFIELGGYRGLTHITVNKQEKLVRWVIRKYNIRAGDLREAFRRENERREMYPSSLAGYTSQQVDEAIAWLYP